MTRLMGLRMAPLGRHTWGRLSKFGLPNYNTIEGRQMSVPEAEGWISLGKSRGTNRAAVFSRENREPGAGMGVSLEDEDGRLRRPDQRRRR